MKPYDHKKIEKKWQREWAKKQLYKASDSKNPEQNEFVLFEFPYPSGNLHVGHWYAMALPDIYARKKRMEGKNVLYPVGFDAFGLPAENAAIKRGLDPKKWTYSNIKTMRAQLETMGASFDTSREIITSDSEYYSWTQWLFTKMFERGLAYRKKSVVNWDPVDKTVLANEQVLADGTAERSGAKVEKRDLEQWFLKITDYADRLIKDLDPLDWPEEIKQAQRNWIGKSDGAEFEFKIVQENPPTFYQFFGSGKIHEDEPYVERDAIMALVKHWSEDKYLGLRWKKVDWETLITGGVEKSQTPEEAARTEIEQETGYKNLKLLNYFGSADSRFYHGPKKQNRYGHFHMYVFQLENDEKKPLSEEEQSNHNPVWLTRKELETFALPSSHRYLINLYEHKGKQQEYGVKVFTTRPDTLYGVTYLVLAPEHPLVSHFIHQSSNAIEIDEYVRTARTRNQIERTTETKEKTGVELKGVKAMNPATGETIPVFVADYVLDTYGTGAIMAVPAHDERDFQFAKKYTLPIKEVITPYFIDPESMPVPGKPVVRRTNVRCIVKHWQEDTFLAVTWKPQYYGGRTFLVTGGVEDSEDIVQSAIREIQEETGYQNIKYVGEVRDEVHAEYYAQHKDVNRFAVVKTLVFTLEDGTKKEKSTEDQKLHDNVWVPRKDLKKTISGAELPYVIDIFLGNERPYTGFGELKNSGEFSGIRSEEARKKIAEKFGKVTVTYKLRDWSIGRQRYWGTPVPIVYDPEGKPHAIPEKHLPWKLPTDVDHTPTGEPPLARSRELAKRTEKIFGKGWKPDVETMDTFVDSSWYYIRYTDPNNKNKIADQKKIKNWLPVDYYFGGAEHTTLHLLYSRFFYKVMHDIGLVENTEPFTKRLNRGLILGPDGNKMSKSKGNVINPDDIVAKLGADTVRMYLAFIGPYNEPGSYPWDPNGVVGIRRFLERVWKLALREPKFRSASESKFVSLRATGLESQLNKTIKKVSEDIEALKYNTAISALMILLNTATKLDTVSQEEYETILKLLAPFAPHITEELWANLGHKTSIHLEPWPHFDPSTIQADMVTIVVQVNGKVRAEFQAEPAIAEAEATKRAQELAQIKKWLDGKQIKKIIFVPGKLVNIVAL
jgi:leucyl-tRNA synthetase